MRRVLAALALCVVAPYCAAATEQIVTLAPRPGVTLPYLLVHDAGATPKAVAIAFVGTYGLVGLANRPRNAPLQFSPAANFLVRARGDLVAADVALALVDAPSDQLPRGTDDAFRMGDEHATDIRAVGADLRARFPGAKLFLLGTSRGTISAAALAVKLAGDVQGTILTSTLTRADRLGPGLSGFAFERIAVPVLVVHHRDDRCKATPYADAERLGKRFPLVSVSGGNATIGDVCDALSPHGFYGREAPTAAVLRDWMLGREIPHEIP